MLHCYVNLSKYDFILPQLISSFCILLMWLPSCLGNVQLSYDGFLSNFRPPPLYEYGGILTFQPIPPRITFLTNPLPHIYRKYSRINCKLRFLIATIKDNVWRFGQTSSPQFLTVWANSLPKRHMTFKRTPTVFCFILLSYGKCQSAKHLFLSFSTN